MAFGDIPKIKRTTRNGFELAQSVLFVSGIQHFAEIPQGMAPVPDPDYVISVVLEEGIEIFDFLNRLKVFVLATHLGDNRSLVLPVAHTIYYEMGAEQRALMGIADNQLRISVGIEEIIDLTSDFDQALALS